MGSHVWFCGYCLQGPMNEELYEACIFCYRPRDSHSDLSFESSFIETNQESAASSSVAHRSEGSTGFGNPAGKVDNSSARHTLEGASPKSGSPINSHPDVTHEETSTSLSKISNYVHRRAERGLPVEEPVDETQDHENSEKSTITGDEISIPEDIHRRVEREFPIEEPVDETQDHGKSEESAIMGDEISIPEDMYEQWIAADTLRNDDGDTRLRDDVEQEYIDESPSDPESEILIPEDIYEQWIAADTWRNDDGDTRLSDDVEQEYIDESPSDPESDVDSFISSPTEPRTGDHSSDVPNRSERTKTRLTRGHLLPPVIYMLFGPICGMVTRLFEPNPLPGRTRIRWRCQCGQMLYDDFIETCPGALADLEQHLNSTRGFYELNPSSSNTTSHASNRHCRTSLSGWLGPLRWPWKTARVQSPSLPLHERQDALDRVSVQLPADNERRALCIFVCIPYCRTANKLYPAVVENTSTDNGLFSSLRSKYKTAREQHIPFFSLKTIKSIRFVRFEVYFQGLVDVRTTPDIPDESRSDEYSYHPMPAEFIPPIGENHMMHLYTYPEEAGHTSICLGKIPKKIRGLEWLPTHSQGSKVGWSLHVVEGLDVMKLWVSGFIGFIISIMFGIAWSMIKDDMQSGFAVVACMLTGLLFTTGMVKVAYEPK